MPAINKMRGNAWVFGDLMDVDWEICPFDTLNEMKERGVRLTEETIGKYCMTNVDPDFPKKVKKGDFIVGGKNFGYGHDHYQACVAIRGAGVAAVLCESTNANFQRNSVHHGLPVVVIPGIKQNVKEGDQLELDLVAGTLVNLTNGKKMSFVPYPSFLLDILASGGLYNHLRDQFKAAKAKAKA